MKYFLVDYQFQASDAGVKVFAVTLISIGTQTVSAAQDGSPSVNGTSNGIVVGPGPLSAFVVTAPGTVDAGISFNYEVTAVDQYDNIIDNDAGTVTFTSTDGAASLPSPYTFLSTDYGSRIFTATLNTVGIKTITATDNSLGKSGNSGSITVTAASSSQYGQPSVVTSYLPNPGRVRVCLYKHHK